MQKHITLAAVLTIVYRAFVILGAVVLFVLAVAFRELMETLIAFGSVRPDEVPMEILDLVPMILVPIAMFMLVVSTVAIVGAVGVLNRKEWARIVLLVVSFFNLVRIPLGTILGGYTIWVLLNKETIRMFNPSVRTPSVAT